MGGLAVIAAILVLLLLYVRYKRKKRRGANTENQLVYNAAELGTTTPVPSLTNLNDSHMGTSHLTSVNSDNSGTEINNRNGSAMISDGSRISDSDERYNGDSNTGTSDHGSHMLDVRYSDVLKTGNLKISDC